MSATPGMARVVAPVPAPALPPASRPPPAGPTSAPGLARRAAAARLGSRWLARLAWSLERTGRPGLLGVGLLLASGVFLVSTHLRTAAEVEALRATLAAAGQAPRSATPARPAGAADPLPPLPASTEVPGLLRQLFRTATQARLAVDTGRYELESSKGGDVVRYQVAFPVTGPYAQIREFIDTTLATMPQAALSGLALERKSIAEGEVEAQLRFTFFTAAAGARGTAREAAAPPAAARVVMPRHAAALFAQHSWTVLKLAPVPPPVAPPPPPDPTAPPLPYTLVGSVAPAGEPPVFFLARGDRMIPAHVGDKLDGVYQLESAAGGQLVFLYLPLNIRQNIPVGVTP